MKAVRCSFVFFLSSSLVVCVCTVIVYPSEVLLAASLTMTSSICDPLLQMSGFQWNKNRIYVQLVVHTVANVHTVSKSLCFFRVAFGRGEEEAVVPTLYLH